MLTPERVAELRWTQYSPVEALRQHIDGAGGLRERMDEGDVTAFEADVVMGYDTLQDEIDAQAEEIARLRRALDEAGREREVLVVAARLLGPVAEYAERLEAERDPERVYEFGASQIVSQAQDAYNDARDLLDGEKGGGGE